jgi:hypothetical protein
MRRRLQKARRENTLLRPTHNPKLLVRDRIDLDNLDSGAK